MKAVVVTGAGGTDALSVKEIAEPELRPHDVLVRVQAASMNPIDVLNRQQSLAGLDDQRVLGYDGCGVVTQLGAEAQGFAEGDVVMFAGDITRNGSNAELIAVDSRICAKKPESMSPAQAAALPLVSLTAWEFLLENLRLRSDGSDKGLVFMMLNGAGGLGSAAIQIAKHVLGCETIVATASRPETEEWCRSLGATHVINHREDLGEELKRVGLEKVDVCLVGVPLEQAYDRVVPIMRTGGYIGGVALTEPAKVDVSKLFMPARLTLSFEFMFARTMVGANPEKQGEILKKIAALVDEGKFVDITKTTLKGMTAEAIAEAHDLSASGKQIGKIAIDFAE